LRSAVQNHLTKPFVELRITPKEKL